MVIFPGKPCSVGLVLSNADLRSFAIIHQRLTLARITPVIPYMCFVELLTSSMAKMHVTVLHKED